MNSILTVTTPAESHDLTTLNVVKAELGIDPADESKNALLKTYIRQASNAVASYCRRVFGRETVSEVFRLNGAAYSALVLTRRPVTEIVSVTEDTTLLTAVTDYELDPLSGLLYRISGEHHYKWVTSKVTVVYTAGYLLIDGLPHAIERATVLLAKQYFYAAARDPLLRAEDIPGVMSQQYWVGDGGDNGALSPEARDLLGPFRDYHVS